MLVAGANEQAQVPVVMEGGCSATVSSKIISILSNLGNLECHQREEEHSAIHVLKEIGLCRSFLSVKGQANSIIVFE